MEIRTGVDIIEVARIQEAIEKQKEGFLKRVYTQKEIDYCKRHKKNEISTLCSKVCSKRGNI